MKRPAWQIEPDSAVQLGWLHLTHLSAREGDNDYSYPDFLQVVFCAKAGERTVGRYDPWTDVDGYESASRLITLDEAMGATSIDLLAHAFLRLLGDKLASGEIA
jgi:hypothetical protein